MIAYVDENGMITSTPPAEKHSQRRNKAGRNRHINSQKKTRKNRSSAEDVSSFSMNRKASASSRTYTGVEKYFFHINNVLTDIAENNIVTFDLERGLKGMNAVNVALEVEKGKGKERKQGDSKYRILDEISQL